MLATTRSSPDVTTSVLFISNFNRTIPDGSLRLCYEASYIGYSLQRDLTASGYHCDVIAPGSIPRKGRSKSVKTDRIDALDLAQCNANDLLTIVQVPDVTMEQDRDLIRSLLLRHTHRIQMFPH